MLPTQLRVCGRVFKVVIVDGFADDTEQSGESDYAKRLITVKKDEDEAEMQSTLLHELIHIALGHSGMDELLRGISEATEEAVVCAIENALAPLYVIREPSKKGKKK